MSNYEEEKGTLVLPTAAIMSVRRALVDAINQDRAATLALAAKAHDYLRSDAGKADRLALSKALKGTYQDQAEDLLYRIVDRFNRDAYGRQGSGERTHVATSLLLPRASHPKPGEKATPRKLQAPKKKDLPSLPAQTWAFYGPECSVHIDQEKRILRWSVAYNNHSVERAWESTLGKALSAALSKVKWTRATGGVFNYSNEYARDAAIEDGYNPVSTSRSFGPLGKQTEEARMGFPRMRRKAKR